MFLVIRIAFAASVTVAVLVLLYAGLCAVRPFGPCGRCDGQGRGKSGRVCRRCGGSGERPRIGSRLWVTFRKAVSD